MATDNQSHNFTKISATDDLHIFSLMQIRLSDGRVESVDLADCFIVRRRITGDNGNAVNWNVWTGTWNGMIPVIGRTVDALAAVEQDD